MSHQSALPIAELKFRRAGVQLQKPIDDFLIEHGHIFVDEGSENEEAQRASIDYVPSGEQLVDPNFMALVVERLEQPDRLIGYIAGHVEGGALRFDYIAVHKGWRRRGLTKLLIERLRALAAERGIHSAIISRRPADHEASVAA